MQGFRLHAVVAMAKNRAIGMDGKMPWHLPADLKFFRKLTTGHPIVMGRKTWESLGKPLPNRRNIVLSRQPLTLAGAEVIASPAALFSLPNLAKEIYIIGGAQIYAAFLPLTHTVYVTHIDQEPAADTFFPPFEATFPQVTLLAEDTACRWVQYCWSIF